MGPGVVIAVYRPHEGKDQDLRAILANHLPTLRAEGLVTDRPALLLRSEQDGTYLEIFEWVSAQAASDAHDNPAVQQLWGAMMGCAEMLPLADLKEAGQRFPHFAAVDDLSR